MKNCFGFLFTLILISSCEDEVQLTVKSKAEIVVYGEISNNIGPYQIRITKATNYGYETTQTLVPNPVENAQVVIADDKGNFEELIEQFPGVYVTRKNGIRGTVGRSYILTIKLANGTKYQSKQELLLAAPKVDSIYNIFNKAAKPLDYGFDVFMKLKDPTEEENYYQIRHNVLNEFMVDRPDECVTKPFGCDAGIWRCWVFEQNTQNLLINDRLINGKTISQLVKTVPFEDIVRYAMHIKIASGSKNLYQYWQRLDEQSKVTGSIFDKIPAQIIGNIKNETTGEDALGYFAVIGLTSKKYMIDRYESAPQIYREQLLEYNNSFRKRAKFLDCTRAYDWVYNASYLQYIREYKPNNIGANLPAWWYEKD